MSTVIEISGKEYRFDGMEEYTVDGFNGVVKRLTDEPGKAYLTVLREFFGIPDEVLSSLHVPDLALIDFEELLKVELRAYEVKASYDAGTFPDLGGCTIGEFGDYEYFYLQEGDKRLEFIVANLLSSGKSMDELVEMADHIGRTMKLGDVMGVVHAYAEFREGIYREHEGLFNMTVEDPDEDEPGEDEEPEQDGWGWLGIILSLCNDDVTRMAQVQELKLTTCLNFMSYRKEQNDRLKEEMKLSK